MGSSYTQSASRHTSTTSSTMIFRPLLMFIVVVFLFYFSRAARVCSDGSAPTCEDGSTPTRDMNRATPPCPGQGRGRQGKPNTWLVVNHPPNRDRMVNVVDEGGDVAEGVQGVPSLRGSVVMDPLPTL